MAGYDPGTGKQIQRSISGKTWEEVAQKRKLANASMDAGTYTAPSRMTSTSFPLSKKLPSSPKIQRGTLRGTTVMPMFLPAR